MKTEIFHLHALSALHVGVGQAVGTVDLPIARSKATNLPLVPGSALKGVLRDEFANNEDQALLFGPATIDNPDNAHAGAVAFGDAHLLLLPVRSLAGIMAWATCPFVLKRYASDRQRAKAGDAPKVPAVEPGKVATAGNHGLLVAEGKAVFDDLDLGIQAGSADAWAKFLAPILFGDDGDDFIQHFAILSDSDFGFLADTATEVRAHIRINDEKGTVERGALWYEENLPAESVLWGILGMGKGRKPGATCSEEETCGKFRHGLGDGKLVQIGGKGTTGRGLVRFLAQGGAA